MRASFALLAALLALSALLAVPFSDCADAAVMREVSYEERDGITITFPNGRYVQDGGDLVFTVTSAKYDMEKTGASFFIIGEDGKADTTDPRQYEYTHVRSGNSVTYTFKDIRDDIKMEFTDPVLREGYEETEDVGPSKAANGQGIDMTTAVLCAATVLAAVLLILCYLSIERMKGLLPPNRD